MSKTSYVYNVQILVEDEHHASALTQLLNKLNKADFVDYKVVSGITLGQEIDARVNNADTKTSIPIPRTDTKTTAASSPSVSAAPKQQNEQYDLSIEVFRQCKNKNKLIRLIVNRGLGIKASIPCRVINIDENDLLITVYHVDEKQVYTFRLNEIEDFIES